VLLLLLLLLLLLQTYTYIIKPSSSSIGHAGSASE
jgi:hypothetical protein